VLILLDYKIEKHLEALLISDNVIYRPDIENKPPRILERSLHLVSPDVLITRTVPNYKTFFRWKESKLAKNIFIIYLGEKEIKSKVISDIPIHCISFTSEDNANLEAFKIAEEINTCKLNQQTNSAILSEIKNSGNTNEQKTIIVGAGVVNLVTAYYLVKHNISVNIYDAGPDPRTTPEKDRVGCTHGGDDARMFSLSETRHHLSKSHLDLVNKDTKSPFELSFSNGGWLTCDHNSLNYNDFKWESDFEDILPWLPEIFEKDLISFNQESEPLWEQLKLDEPRLFEDVGYIPKVLRLYSTAEQLKAAIITEGNINSTIRIIDIDTLKSEYPALQNAVESGSVIGAIEIVGFTINIHKFLTKLLNYLEKSKIVFHWNTNIEHIERNANGAVIGLSTKSTFLKANNYVISPGAYGGNLLNGTLSQNKISSVVGSWLRLPNLEPKLEVSLKISRSGFASDGAAVGANILIGTDSTGQDIIHISSGHGYVGENPNNIDPMYINDLFKVVEETAKHYFPDCYKKAVESGLLKNSFKCCVRPWTPSGLGIFEITRTDDNGLLILTGGHNTGGFAQSPSIGMAVLSALQGNHHRMHSAYHPDRVKSFVSFPEHVTFNKNISKYNTEIVFESVN